MNDVSRLLRLLDLRRNEEDRRKAEMARARQALDDAEQALLQLDVQRTELQSVMDAIRGESVGQLRTVHLLVEQVDRGIKNATTMRGVAATTVATKAAELAEATARRESLERIVVPRQEHARALQRLAEQKLDDEAALIRFRRGGQAAS